MLRIKTPLHSQKKSPENKQRVKVTVLLLLLLLLRDSPTLQIRFLDLDIRGTVSSLPVASRCASRLSIQPERLGFTPGRLTTELLLLLLLLLFLSALCSGSFRGRQCIICIE
ncbi:uncharacterized protein V6R79_010024 [Siganus canaliculatus]